MGNLYDHLGFVSRKHDKQIAGLTEPLKRFFGIDRFWRNSHRVDGSYSVIGNCPPVAELFFGMDLYVGHPYFRNPQFFQSGYALPELLQSSDYEQTQGRLRNCHHVLIHIEKDEQGFVEYGFASSEFIPGFETSYLNHLPAITHFIHFFETNGDRLIQKAADYSINIVETVGEKYHEKPQLKSPMIISDKEFSFRVALEQNPEKQRGLLSLTKSERAALRHYLAGATTEEIAQKLFRSPRTVETHLENAKSKMGVHSRSKLFEALIPFASIL